jgi:arsenite methyltransferase
MDPRVVKDAPIIIENDAMKTLLGPIEFFSATYRMFKIDELEPYCEDYGQAVIYKGNIKDHPYFYALDSHHKTKTGIVFPVYSNSYRMLKDTRFASAFEFIGDFSRHYGLFEGCGKSIPFKDSKLLDLNCCNYFIMGLVYILLDLNSKFFKYSLNILWNVALTFIS